jgi:hypothetical protein
MSGLWNNCGKTIDKRELSAKFKKVVQKLEAIVCVEHSGRGWAFLADGFGVHLVVDV